MSYWHESAVLFMLFQACVSIWLARCSPESWRVTLLLVHVTTGGSIFELANSLMRLNFVLRFIPQNQKMADCSSTSIKKRYETIINNRQLNRGKSHEKNYCIYSLNLP